MNTRNLAIGVVVLVLSLVGLGGLFAGNDQPEMALIMIVLAILVVALPKPPPEDDGRGR